MTPSVAATATFGTIIAYGLAAARIRWQKLGRLAMAVPRLVVSQAGQYLLSPLIPLSKEIIWLAITRNWTTAKVLSQGATSGHSSCKT